MLGSRGRLEVDDLLRILLVLVVVWIGLDVLEELLGWVFGPFGGVVRPVVGIVVLALIVLYLTDRL